MGNQTCRSGIAFSFSMHMDWLKTILDRLSGFLASVIPGSVLLLLFVLHKSALITTIWEASSLTYNAKIILGIVFSLALGHTVNSALTTLMRGLGGAIAGYMTSGPPKPEPDVRPWQNRNWRALLTRYLGEAAPENINPLYGEVFQLRMKAIQDRPQDERAVLAATLLNEKAQADINDSEWSQWWNHFHHASFLDRTPEALLHDQIDGGFCAASIIVLIALPFTPQLRVWWIVAVSVFWIVVLILRTVGDIRAVMNPWSSYTRQVERLDEKTRQNAVE